MKASRKSGKASAVKRRKSSRTKSTSKKSANKPATKPSRKATPTTRPRKTALKTTSQIKLVPPVTDPIAPPVAPVPPATNGAHEQPTAELKREDVNGERYGEVAPSEFNQYVADETGRSPKIMRHRPDGSFSHSGLIKSRATFRIRWVSKILNYSNDEGGETRKKRLVNIRLTCGDNSFRHALIFMTDAKYLDALRKDCEAGRSLSNFRLDGGEQRQSRLIVTTETTFTNEPPDREPSGEATEASKTYRLSEISLTPERLARIKRPDVRAYAEEMLSLYANGVQLICRNGPVGYYYGWGEWPEGDVYPCMVAFTPGPNGGTVREWNFSHVYCDAMVRDSPNANQPTYDTIYKIVSVRGVELHTVSNAKEFDKNSSPLKNILAQHGYSSTNNAHFEIVFSALKSKAPEAARRRDFIGWTSEGDMLMCDKVMAREGERTHAQAGIFPPRTAPDRYTAALKFNPSIELKAEFLRRVTIRLFPENCAPTVLGIFAYQIANMLPRFTANGVLENASEAAIVTGDQGTGKNSLISIVQGFQGGGFTELQQGPQLAFASTMKHRSAVASDGAFGTSIGMDFTTEGKIVDKLLPIITNEVHGRYDGEEGGYLGRDQSRNLRGKARGGVFYTCEPEITPILCEHGFNSTASRLIEFRFPSGATSNKDVIDWLTDNNPTDGRWPRGMTAAQLRWAVGRDFVLWIMRQHGDAPFVKYWHETRSEISLLQRSRTDVARIADNRGQSVVISLLTALHFFRQFLKDDYGQAVADVIQWIDATKSDLVAVLAARSALINATVDPAVVAERHHKLLLSISAEIGLAIYFEPPQNRGADRVGDTFLEKFRDNLYAPIALGLVEHTVRSRPVLAPNSNAAHAGFARFKSDDKLYLIVSDRAFGPTSALVRHYARLAKEAAGVKIDGSILRCFFERLNSTPVKGGLEVEYEVLNPTPGFMLEEREARANGGVTIPTPRPSAASSGFAMANGKKPGLPN